MTSNTTSTITISQLFLSNHKLSPSAQSKNFKLQCVTAVSNLNMSKVELIFPQNPQFPIVFPYILTILHYWQNTNWLIIYITRTFFSLANSIVHGWFVSCFGYCNLLVTSLPLANFNPWSPFNILLLRSFISLNTQNMSGPFKGFLIQRKLLVLTQPSMTLPLSFHTNYILHCDCHTYSSTTPCKRSPASTNPPFLNSYPFCFSYYVKSNWQHA